MIYQKMPSPSKYNEENSSQIPALELLEKLGYNILKPEDAEIMRGSLYNVILKPVLKQQLEKLNSYTYKKETFKFSEKNINQAIDGLDEPLTNGLVKTNEKIYDYLMLGKSYQEILPDKTKRSFNLNYIDFENPQNNVFHAVPEFAVERQNSNKTARPDIVLFVNGIPLGVIECKRVSEDIKQGISQMIRNQGKDYIPQLFKFTQILVSTNKNDTKYATASTPEKFWSHWREEDEKFLQTQISKHITTRKPTIQDENLISLFEPKRFFELIKYFIVFDKDIKKIARYQQYFAIKETIKTINERDEIGNRQSGVIWHTQGSGKSLTMVMFAKYILSKISAKHPKVIVVTDRIDLDKQIHSTFNHTRLKASRATTGEKLIELIKDNNADIVTTIINKFEKSFKKKSVDNSKDIFILIDESHRTQYGEFHIKMKNTFPNACYLGFTGTPLLKREKNTLIKFGKLIHKYTINDAVEDKAIVPLLYEGRMIDQTVNKKAIDLRLDIITRNITPEQKRDVKQKWAKFEKIASSNQRINLIAFDITSDFLTRKENHGIYFKGMLATNSKIDAIRYKEAFDELKELDTQVIISGPDEREDHEEVDNETKSKILKFWQTMMSKYGTEESYLDTIKNEFVYGDSIDILIVVDKLLTGFDAPRASILYIDKELKEHNLLQAIARVNRLFDNKEYGFIVDYRGLLQRLDEAMDLYSGAGLENFDPGDIKGAVLDIIKVIGDLRESHTNLLNIFISIKNKSDIEEYEILLEKQETREFFYEILASFSKNLSIARESEKIYNAIDEKEMQKFKQDLNFFVELRKSVKIRYSDNINYKEYEPQMRNLMDNYIVAEEVIKITKPVDIMDKKNFTEELERLGSKRAKADAIRTRITRSISQNFEENPAYYEKFSKLVDNVIQDYKNKRISESDYFDRMEDIMKKYQSGQTDTKYPNSIKNDIISQSYYGILKNIIFQINQYFEDNESIADISIKIKNIIDKNIKIDFQNNIDIMNKIAQEIEDLLFDYKEDKKLNLDYENIDKIIETIQSMIIKRFAK